MTNDQTPRLRLKTRTMHAHDRVDAAFSAFDIAHPHGLKAFLRAQGMGLTTCANALRAFGPPVWADAAARRRDAVRFDLSALGHVPTPDFNSADAPLPSILLEPRGVRQRSLAALGIGYVVAGSLHGTAVLRGQWNRTARRDLFPEGFTPLFFEGAAWKPMWANIMNLLHDSHMTDTDLDWVVEAANRAFAVFETSATRAQIVTPVAVSPVMFGPRAQGRAAS